LHKSTAFFAGLVFACHACLLLVGFGTKQFWIEKTIADGLYSVIRIFMSFTPCLFYPWGGKRFLYFAAEFFTGPFRQGQVPASRRCGPAGGVSPAFFI
jgi:hypothetical protein